MLPRRELQLAQLFVLDMDIDHFYVSAKEIVFKMPQKASASR
jgi:hypothetical protein